MLDLSNLDDVFDSENGKPLELSIADVMEDPTQPRLEFPIDEMEKIAESIKERGVKTPISVHLHPTNKGKYIINHGARRYRGSIMAGKTTIPAFIDEDHTDYDQVMENKERLGHTPIEIALFIQKKLDEGEKKGVIAKKLNENAVYITTHLALINMPKSLEKAYESGCRSPKTLYDLRKLFEEYPSQVENWINECLESGKDIYRSGVQTLAKELKKLKAESESESESEVDSLMRLQREAEKLIQARKDAEKATESHSERNLQNDEDQQTKPKKATESHSERNLQNDEDQQTKPKKAPESHSERVLKSPQVRVVFDNQDAVLILSKAPTSRGFAWIRLIASNEIKEVDCLLLEIESISEE